MSTHRDSEDELLVRCHDLYARTRFLWESLEGAYPTWHCRFSILYGPPMLGPDLFILGSNPGFDPAYLYDDEILTWPKENEYITQKWPLATKLRSIFANAGLENLLERSIGTNRLFFKSKSLDHHETGLGWADNPKAIRERLEAYCSHELEQLIRLIKPKFILVLGLSVFDDFSNAASRNVEGVKGRRVATVGSADGIKTIGIIHPTGARVSNADWAIVEKALALELGGTALTNDLMPDGAMKNQPPKLDIQSRILPTSKSTRQKALRPDTVVRAAGKPPGTYAYQPIHDFWSELSRLGDVTVEDFHQHMVSKGWRRPQGGALTYAVTRTDIACMCREGFAMRVSE